MLRDYVRAYNSWMFVRHDRTWALAAESAVRDLCRQGKYHAVITNGPPHMVHEAGRRLSAASGLPHVMDLRDPWSLLERVAESVASPVWFQRARAYERRAVRRAALVVMNTEAARDAMAAVHPAAANRIIAVMNGYDDDPIPVIDPGTVFRISYAGTIYLDRDPRPLFAATARVVSELKLSPSELTLEFMGDVVSYGGRALPDIAADEGIGSFLRLSPSRSRREAMAFQARASVLARSGTWRMCRFPRDTCTRAIRS